MSDFKKGDLVVITGSKLDCDGLQPHNHTLASVVEIGKYDLFAVCKRSSTYRSAIFKVPKAMCVKVRAVDAEKLAEVREPKVGDLVMSVTQSFSTENIEKKSGILKEITDMAWQFKTAKIMIGSKYESVPYDSLIVLEE